ncbi:putative spore germination protein GerPB [Paenibacillus konkukensis]|uniref:Spore germination protein GerPB n=1 Tax=Paenibacillus konkukensis TaxID=2020716 RepID=A0ABY4RYN3_9BACL|nr:spore germination protein GerPB [Paenibacillus konkukensis]UQZ87426.1 putative spore germination protein GerPB [Paenibacillus konkukensis]
MNLVVNQHIVIHQLRVDSVSNSSILQIGSAGMIKPLSNNYNTSASKEAQSEAEEKTAAPLVPLPSPS